MLLRLMVTLHLITGLLPIRCDRRARPPKTPSLHVHPSVDLPRDVQITTHLNPGEKKRLFYNTTTSGGALSFTLSTCSDLGEAKWTITGPPFANKLQGSAKEVMETTHVHPVLEGVYTLEIASPDGGYVHVYVSTEVGGPQVLRLHKNSGKLKLFKRPRKKLLTVRWNASVINLKNTTYCLVVSTKRPYKSFCTLYRPQSDPSFAIWCVGRKTHHTLTHLSPGQDYFFTLFAMDQILNLTYPWGSTRETFTTRIKPTGIKDGQAAFANLKELDGKAVFRYKVGKARPSSTRSLELFVLPCGGAVDVEVRLKDRAVVPSTRVEGFGNISVPNPEPQARYYVKIFALDHEELEHINGVEVYATARSLARIPLPTMPKDMGLKELRGMRTCDSVTIGWISPIGPKKLRYCIRVKEGAFRDPDGTYKIPNQCGLENRLRKSADYAMKLCKDVEENEELVHHTINHLKPDRSYIVQVTVKKPKGRVVSYDLLQVYTKDTCEEDENDKIDT